MLLVTIPEDVRRELQAALQKAGPRECGGVLLGEHVGLNHFTVRQITVQHRGSIASFLRDLQTAVKAIGRFFLRTKRDFARFNYMGEWHSHPLFTTEPSGTDHASMREIAADPGVGANFVVLLIFRLAAEGNLEGSAHCYLPDGSISSAHLEVA